MPEKADLQQKPQTPTPARPAWRSRAWLYAILFAPTAVVMWLTHEWAHWQAGEILGYDMWMTLNKAGPVDGKYNSSGDHVIVLLTGPALTLMQGALACWLILARRAWWAYPALFLAFSQRALAFGLTPLHPNDEALASTMLGLPIWVIPTAVVATLLFMLVLASRALRMGWRGNLIAYGATSVSVTAIVFSDQIWRSLSAA